MKCLQLIAFLFPLCLYGQTLSLQDYVKKAREASQAGDYAAYYSLITEAYKLHPYHPAVLYEIAKASALNDRHDDALTYLKELIEIKANADLSIDAFSALSALEKFQQLRARQTDLQKTFITSDTAFVIRDKTLHVESMATGEKPGVFYLSSIHKRKIIRVDAKGNVSDFTTSAQDGLTSVFGIKIQNNKILWACTSPMAEMENFDSTAQSAVFRYDLKTKKLLGKYFPASDKKEFVLGDLVIHPSSGQVFVSDSKNNIIFIVNEQSGKLEPFFTSNEFWNIQGIAFNGNGRYLFVSDYVKGIYRLDLTTKQLIQLRKHFDESLKSTDGLVFHNNSLICIQNFIYPMRVSRYALNDAQDELLTCSPIDVAHPVFNEPTNGCISGDYFYYVANSAWSGYNDDHSLKPADQLQDVIILKTKLTRLKSTQK